jgi:hypothetical protein
MTKRSHQNAITLAFALGTFLFAASANARPPTVMNSPGYERALQESRKQHEETQPAQAVRPAIGAQKKNAHRGREPKSDARH